MKTATIIISALLAISCIVFGLKSWRNLQRYNRFQQEMKPEDNCVVYYGEGKHYGTLKSSVNTAGEDLGLGKIWITVSFRESEDYPIDPDGHKIIAKNFTRDQIYPCSPVKDKKTIGFKKEERKQ